MHKMKMCRIVIVMVAMVVSFAFGQDDKSVKFEDHILMITTAAPVAGLIGIAGMNLILGDTIHGPADSIVYYKSGNDPVTIRDHNSRLYAGLGLFLLSDMVICFWGAGQLDEKIVEHRKKKKAFEITPSLTRNRSVGVEFTYRF